MSEVMVAGGNVSLKSEVDDVVRPIVERLLRQWSDPKWQEIYHGVRGIVGGFCDTLADLHDGSPVYDDSRKPIHNFFQRKKVLSGRCEKVLLECEKIAGPLLSKSQSASLREAATAMVQSRGGNVRKEIPYSGDQLARYATKTEQELNEILSFVEYVNSEGLGPTEKEDEKGLCNLMKLLCASYLARRDADGVSEITENAIDVQQHVESSDSDVQCAYSDSDIIKGVVKKIKLKNNDSHSGVMTETSVDSSKDESGQRSEEQSAAVSIANLYDGLTTPSLRTHFGFIRESVERGSVLAIKAGDGLQIRAVVVGGASSIPGMGECAHLSSPMVIICDGLYVLGIATIPTFAELYHLDWQDVRYGGFVPFKQDVDKLLELAVSENEKFFIKRAKSHSSHSFLFSGDAELRLSNERTKLLVERINKLNVSLPQFFDSFITGDLVLESSIKNDVKDSKRKGAWRPVRQEGSGRLGFTFSHRIVGKKDTESLMVCMLDPKADGGMGGMDVACGAKTTVLRDNRESYWRPLYTPSRKPVLKRDDADWWGRMFINKILEVPGGEDGFVKRVSLTDGILLSEAIAIYDHLFSLEYDARLVDTTPKAQKKTTAKAEGAKEVSKAEVVEDVIHMETKVDPKIVAEVTLIAENSALREKVSALEEIMAALDARPGEKRGRGRPKGSKTKFHHSVSESASVPAQESAIKPTVPEMPPKQEIGNNDLEDAISLVQWGIQIGLFSDVETVLGGMLLKEAMGLPYQVGQCLSVSPDLNGLSREGMGEFGSKMGALVRYNLIQEDIAANLMGKLSMPLQTEKAKKRRSLFGWFRRPAC